ncbi:MAG: (Fe-S)-binding protein [Caldilineales bacterium]|nr:(Fe-S)-binding protein [Caldilineales bacterium]MCW5858690.1 (Fe-S)-binding protein [Caldilineales bacterium]
MTLALLASCTATAFRPGLTAAILKLAGDLGLDLAIPKAQTCCGLPAWNAGQSSAALAAAQHTLKVFGGYETIVTASPGCWQMLRQHIPALLAGGPQAAEAQHLAGRSLTWLDFLAHNGYLDRLDLSFSGKIALFVPCSQADDRPLRQILARVRGAAILPDPVRQCCGWGANLTWRHPDLGSALARPVTSALRLSRTDLVLTSDVDCLQHLAPLLRETGGPAILHLAEFLADPRVCQIVRAA